ncbi:MAG: HK97 family phage prohead protease [Candidatus Methylomirabilales bacterium]
MNDATGDVEGCHDTLEEAQAQLAALNINVHSAREQRDIPIDRISFRADSGRFVGHAAVFGQKTAIGDPKRFGFWEQVAPSAFDRALGEGQDVRLLVDHDPSRLLARTGSSTMKLATDRKGLRVEADMADTSVGRDVRVLLERGDLSQMSFGFSVMSETWVDQKDHSQLRTIEDLDLFDVSIVTFPAYVATDASVRAMVEGAGLSRIRRQRWDDMRKRFDALPGTPGRKER